MVHFFALLCLSSVPVEPDFFSFYLTTNQCLNLDFVSFVCAIVVVRSTFCQCGRRRLQQNLIKNETEFDFSNNEF